MKIDTFNVAAPSTKTATKTFYDPRFPERAITLTLKSPDLVDVANIEDTIVGFVSHYSSLPFPAVQGRIIKIGPYLARQVSTIYCLQAGELDDRYSMEELVAMSVSMPTVFNDISYCLAELSAESDMGKLMGDRLSIERSSDIIEDTQSLMSE